MVLKVYNLLKEHLEENGVKYREINHKPGASAEEYHNAVGCQYEQQAKCLLIKAYGDQEYFVVLVIQVQKRADLENVKNLLHAKKARMANRNELNAVTECDFGELHPFAKVFNLKLLMDKDFLKEQEIFLNAGKVDVSFVVSPQDLQRIEDPTMV